MNENMNIEDILKQAKCKVQKYHNSTKYNNIKNIILEFCKNNGLIMGRENKYNSYILYSSNPFIIANDLCNLLFKEIPYIKLATTLYQKEFILFDIFNPLVIIRTTIVTGQHIDFLELESSKYNILHYPLYVENMFKLKEYYQPSNIELINHFIHDHITSLVLSPYDKQPMNHLNQDVTYIKTRLSHYIFKFLSKEKNIFLGEHGFNLYKGDKINNSTPIYAIVNKSKENCYYITNVIKQTMANISNRNVKYNINHKVYDNININDYRLNIYRISIRVIIKDKSYTFDLAYLFNSSSYEVLPTYKVKYQLNNHSLNYYIPHEYVYYRFAYLIILFNNLFKPNNYIQINNCFIKCYELYNPRELNKNIYWIGDYRLESFDKLLFNTKTMSFPYYPFIYSKTSNELRTFKKRVTNI